MALVECVPNFSEGRNKGVIDEISEAIESVEEAELKHVDMGADTNRTVITFVGSVEGIKEAAFRAIERAARLIDMSEHRGSHPRMGATDVCPFIPVKDVTMEDCIRIADEVGERVGKELGIPVYLYENAATEEKRRDLASVRSGEYEGLKDKLVRDGWRPDHGPAEWNERVKRTGATVIGAREFLIAYNINLNTREKKIAWDIAFDLRERGRSKREGSSDRHYWKGEVVKYGQGRYPCGECGFIGETFRNTVEHTEAEHGYDLISLLEDHDYDTEEVEGRSVKKRGRFEYCKAIGWYLEEYDRAQVSINLTNYRKTPIHTVFEEAKVLARKMGAEVTGSEIVGLVPYEALMSAGRFYLKRAGLSAGVPSRDVIETAVQSLGLRDVTDFDPAERIIGGPGELDIPGMVTAGLLDEISRDSPAPGGGSIAALAASIGAALSCMVCNVSTGGRGTEEADSILMPVAERAQRLKDELLKQVDRDANAFNEYVVARKMPHSDEKERERRKEAMRRGLEHAVGVPLQTARLALGALELAVEVAEFGKKGTLSDALVGGQMAYSGVVGAIANVKLNLVDIEDGELTERTLGECQELRRSAEEKMGRVKEIFEGRLY